MKTYNANPAAITQEWYVVDATNQTLGRLASQIAHMLRGKHKPEYTPFVDVGDFIVVTHAAKVHVTGKKRTDKMYYHHTGYPGGIKSVSFEKVISTHPDRAIKLAVKGMLPKGPLGRVMLSKLKVYAGAEHPHEAQQPKALKIAVADKNVTGEV